MDWGQVVSGADWGSVPEWAGALGTVAAVVVALASSWTSRRQLKEERQNAAVERAEAAADRKFFREQQEREAFADRRRAASTVSLRVETSRGVLDGKKTVSHRWVVENHGDQPIRLVVLLIHKGSEAEPSEPETIRYGMWKVIEGRGSLTNYHYHDTDGHPGIEVQFTDCYDVRWRLTEFNQLIELPPDDPAAVSIGA